MLPLHHTRFENRDGFRIDEDVGCYQSLSLGQVPAYGGVDLVVSFPESVTPNVAENQHFLNEHSHLGDNHSSILTWNAFVKWPK